MPRGAVVDGVDGRSIPGVVVSDGLHVRRTGPDGTFDLPDRDDAEFVWVTVPSSYRALEPGWYADVRGGADAQITLTLSPRDSDEQRHGCRFVQVTDLHVSVDGGARLRPMLEGGIVAPPDVKVTGEVTWQELRADLELIVARERPDFVAATGDLADYGQREELEGYARAITGLGAPVASVPGNHDHLSVLTRTAIEEWFADWSTRENTEGLDVSETFQKEVFGGDWRRAGSGRLPWLDVLGPLYYSFDWGGVHVVAYDGEGLRRYGEDYPQDDWLAADLSTVSAGTPVVVLTHFPEDASFFRSRFSGVRLVASLTGHWHGTRLWVDGAARHWTSANVGFAGIDYTARGYRIVEVDDDGARSDWRFVESPDESGARVTGGAAVVDNQVIVSIENGDVSGSVRAIDGWTAPLDVAARGGVGADRTSAYVLDLGAQLVAIDVTSGRVRWRTRLGDPAVRWTLCVPVVADGVVFAGSASSVHAVDATSGHLVWETPLADTDWATSWAGLAATLDSVVIGAANDHLHLAVLDRASGAIRWSRAGRDITGVTTTPVVAGDLVVASHAHGWLTARRLDDGEITWEVPLDDAWPCALTVYDDLAVVRSATGRVSAHALHDGSPRWSCDLGPGVRACRPYSRRPGGDRYPLVAAGGLIWTALANSLVAIDPMAGAIASGLPVDGEVGTVVTLADDRVAAVTTDGRVV